MDTVVIDKKKYVVMEEREFEALQIQAALKMESQTKLTLAEGKERAYKLIDKWAKEK